MPAPARRPLALTAIVPVYNEERLVRESLGRLAAIAPDSRLAGLHIVIVDDGSRDRSWEEIRRFAASARGRRKLRVTAVRQPRNAGKGVAIRAGLARADGDLTVVHDADLEYRPEDLLALVGVFQTETAEAVFGSRFMPGAARPAAYFRHYWGNRFLTLVCNLLTGLRLTDMETCYKMLRTNLYRAVRLEGNDFRVDPELVVKLARLGVRIFELPIRYEGRTFAEGKKIGWADGFAAVWAMWRARWTDRLFGDDSGATRMLIRMLRAPRYDRLIGRSLALGGAERVLELGAGIGSVTRHLLPRRAYVAAEANPVFRDRLAFLGAGRPGFAAVPGEAATLAPAGAGKAFDAVVCVNGLPRAADDARTLRLARGFLRPGGRALLVVPHDSRLLGSLDRELGYRRRYSRAGVAALARAAGFVVETVRPLNRPGWAGWWVGARLLGRRRFGPLEVRLANLAAPLLPLVDRLVPLPPLSLVVALRRA